MSEVEPDMTTTTPPQLDYAPAPSRWRRRWVRRTALAIFLLVVCSVILRFGRPVWTQVQVLYWQRQCLAYTAPPQIVVYEEEPKAAAKLILGDKQYRSYPLTRSSSR